MPLKPTQPTYPPPMARRQAIRNTSQPPLKPRPPINPPPMGHYVSNFLAKSGDEHGDDNDKSKNDYDYGDACERMDNASGDAWKAPLKPRPPTYAPPMAMMQAIVNTSQASLKPGPSMCPSPMGQHVCKFWAQRGDERGDDNDQSKDDYDYVDGCERMAYASRDGCDAPLKPTPPTKPPSMAMRQALWNTSQPSLKPRPSMCPPPMGRPSMCQPTPPTNPPPMAIRQAIHNTFQAPLKPKQSMCPSQPPLKLRPSICPPPMGHHVWKFLAKRGDEHGYDNDKSKDDHDYAGGCDRTNYVAGAQDDDGSADRQ